MIIQWDASLQHSDRPITVHKVQSLLTVMTGKRSPRASKSGNSTNLMKPIWEEGLLTLSRSMKGATGRPSSFSMSLWPNTQHSGIKNTEVTNITSLDVSTGYQQVACWHHLMALWYYKMTPAWGMIWHHLEIYDVTLRSSINKVKYYQKWGTFWIRHRMRNLQNSTSSLTSTTPCRYTTHVYYLLAHRYTTSLVMSILPACSHLHYLLAHICTTCLLTSTLPACSHLHYLLAHIYTTCLLTSTLLDCIHSIHYLVKKFL